MPGNLLINSKAMNINNKQTILFIEDTDKSPFYHMACDDYFLNRCEEKTITGILRFITWKPASISYGRFFNTKKLNMTSITTDGISLVRRPTGGNAILHLNDFTYSLILKKGCFDITTKKEYYVFIAQILQDALQTLGIQSRIKTSPSKVRNNADCFNSLSQYELSADNGLKLIGSAQKILNNAYLQHGSFFYPYDPGRIEKYLINTGKPGADKGKPHMFNYRDIAPVFKNAFNKKFILDDYKITDRDQEAIDSLIKTKYATKEWTFAR